MATITERGPNQFQAIVRIKGYPSQTKTFGTRADAKKWIAVIESEMHRGIFIERTVFPGPVCGSNTPTMKWVVYGGQGHPSSGWYLGSHQECKKPLCKCAVCSRPPAASTNAHVENRTPEKTKMNT